MLAADLAVAVAVSAGSCADLVDQWVADSQARSDLAVVLGTHVRVVDRSPSDRIPEADRHIQAVEHRILVLLLELLENHGRRCRLGSEVVAGTDAEVGLGVGSRMVGSAVQVGREIVDYVGADAVEAVAGSVESVLLTTEALACR